jgi:hypothetical protein
MLACFSTYFYFIVRCTHSLEEDLYIYDSNHFVGLSVRILLFRIWNRRMYAYFIVQRIVE